MSGARASSQIKDGDIIETGLFDIDQLKQAIQDLKTLPEHYSFDDLLECCVHTFPHRSNFPEVLNQIALQATSHLNATRTISLAAVRDLSNAPIAQASSSKITWFSEEQLEVFKKMMPLCSTLAVRPDYWYFTSVNDVRIPVLLLEKVSGGSNLPSLEKTFLKCCSNTVDLFRVYTNICDTASKLSSLIIPTEGQPAVCGALKVTVQWIEGMWSIGVKITSVPKEQFIDTCRELMLEHLQLLPLHPQISSKLNYLIKLPGLDSGMEQLPSAHSLVLQQESKIFKFTPRYTERYHLASIGWTHGALKPVNAVVLPQRIEVIRELDFFCYPRVYPPLNQIAVIRCFSDFVVKSAESLCVLHSVVKMTHGDVRLPNIGFRANRATSVVKVAYLDIDRGRSIGSARIAAVSCALHADVVAWAKMISEILLVFEPSGFGQRFLDDIMSGRSQAQMNEAQINQIKSWLDTDFQARRDAPVNSTSLFEEVMSASGHISAEANVFEEDTAIGNCSEGANIAERTKDAAAGDAQDAGDMDGEDGVGKDSAAVSAEHSGSGSSSAGHAPTGSSGAVLQGAGLEGSEILETSLQRDCESEADGVLNKIPRLHDGPTFALRTLLD